MTCPLSLHFKDTKKRDDFQCKTSVEIVEKKKISSSSSSRFELD
jgi:hypothetical protein